MTKSILLYLDDERDWITKYSQWTWTKTATEAIEILKTGNVKVASLDHDLGDSKDGLDVVDWMVVNNVCPCYVFIHSSNIIRGPEMWKRLNETFPDKVVDIVPSYISQEKSFHLYRDITPENFNDVFKKVYG